MIHKISISLLCFFLLASLSFQEVKPVRSATWIKYIKIQNYSSLERTDCIVPIEIPKDATGKDFQLAEGSVGDIKLPLFLSQTKKQKLYTQITLRPNEEKTVILTQKSGEKYQTLTPRTEPGTDYLFVNYKTAIIISTEDQNPVSFFSSDGKILNSDQKPLILGKGKWFVITSNTPKMMRVLSEKPIYVYSSTLKPFTDLASVEPGDSDTTTLYGNDLFFFTEKHLFMSAYEKTNAKIYDSSDTEVWSGKIENSRGVFLDDLKRGAYHVVSDRPLTIQFGYLDDENFSLLYGKSNLINAYAFGDLMISSLYPNTKVTIKYGNEKVSTKEIQFKQADMTQIVTLIEQFSPKTPEFIFVSIAFNNPVLIYTFSSGNNFGGEYIPGKNGRMSDNEFSFVTLRLSKEFSKEQKNLVELIGIENDTEISSRGAWNQKVVLQEKTNYVFTSGSAMEKITLAANQDIQVSQIHNYHSKGLFYFVPPIFDSSIQLEISDQNGMGMIQNGSSKNGNQNINYIFNQKRLHDFWMNSKTPKFIPISIFFLSIMILLLLLIVLVWIKYGKKRTKTLLSPKKEDKEIESIKTQLFLNKTMEPVLSDEEISRESKESEFTEVKNLFVFPKITLPLEPKREDNEPAKKLEESVILQPNIDPQLLRYPIAKEKQVVENQEPPTNKKVPISIEEGYLTIVNENKIVLDPGSANRLYIEGKLREYPNIYMVKSSSKKITNEVTEKITKIDLNLQDITKANVYKDSLSTFEEAGKALALCKKLKITYYISSYKLPSVIQGIHIIHISDALQ